MKDMNIFMPFVIFMLLASFNINAQTVGLKTYFGTMHYLGDLAPFSHNLSYTEGNIAGGVAYTIQTNEYVTFFGKYMKGSISASDEKAESQGRRRRNLHFKSPIDEFTIGAEISLLTISNSFLKYGVDFYLTGGVSAVKINPKAFIDNQWVELQPLGTEGQGISEFNPKPKYKLWQLAFPLGVGFSFALTPQYNFGLEIAPRITITDYLDDVSSSFVDRDLQIEYQGELTARLANRIGEYVYGPNSTELYPVKSGQQRGNPSNNDWYLFISFHSSMTLGGKLKDKLK